MSKTVVALFDTQQSARAALEALTQKGLSRSQAQATSMDTSSIERIGTSSIEGEKSLGDKPRSPCAKVRAKTVHDAVRTEVDVKQFGGRSENSGRGSR